jgi:CHAT domain-containing protein
MADVAERRGQPLLAKQLLRRALASHIRELPRSLASMERTSLQARIALLGGDLATARGLLRGALSHVEERAPTSLAAAKIRMELGGVALKRSMPLSAIRLFHQALSLRRKLNPGSLDEAEALHALGQAELVVGRWDESARDLCLAVDLLEQRRSRIGGTPEERSMFEASTAAYHRACLEALLRVKRFDAAFHALERSRARSFLSLLADRDLRFSELPPELAAERRRLDARYDRLQAELAQKSPGRENRAIDRLKEELYDIRTRREAHFDKIRRVSPHLTAVESPEPLDDDRAREALDSGTALLSYFVTDAKTFLFILQPGEDQKSWVTAFLIGERELREEIGAFGNLLRNGRSDARALDAQARRLYDLLLRPAEKYIADAERLLISPDGPLHTLPFAALRRKEQYLVEWKPIHSIVSATVYAEITKSRPPARDPGALRLIAFGDPLYPATRESLADPEVRNVVRGQGFPPLPATRREVEGIASLFPQTEVFVGAEATEERAKQLAPEAHLLHFACHGFLNDRFPLNSGLALTLPDQPAEGQDNGLLQAWEIFEGVRLDADLVTLSACNTALGPEMGGEGLVGLTRAFQYAGARSVLASLWGVSDASTGALMKRFYTHLRAGKTKDEALRAAQTELIHENDALSHPYHWAAFQLFGDWK